MDEKGPLNLGEYLARVEDEGERVECARCGMFIPAATPRCPHCGIHFNGMAEDFTPGAQGREDRRCVRAYVLLIVFVLGVLLGVLGWVL